MNELGDTRADITRQKILDVGVRHVNDMDDAAGFMTSVKNSWCATLPGFAKPDRIEYLTQFVERRTVAAIRSIEARR